MSATSGFCERCGNFLTQHCNGDRNTCMSILLNKIEALQQENNGWQERYDELDAGHSRLFKDFCKLRQENEQLQTQLDEWKYEVKCLIDEVVARDKEIEQLQIQTVRMREALQKAREALEYCIDTLAPMAAVSHLGGQKGKMQEVCEEALAAIDKVIGGEGI